MRIGCESSALYDGGSANVAMARVLLGEAGVPVSALGGEEGGEGGLLSSFLPPMHTLTGLGALLCAPMLLMDFQVSASFCSPARI